MNVLVYFVYMSQNEVCEINAIDKNITPMYLSICGAFKGTFYD